MRSFNGSMALIIRAEMLCPSHVSVDRIPITPGALYLMSLAVQYVSLLPKGQPPPALHERPIIVIRNKADLLTLRLFLRGEIPFSCEHTRFSLGQVSKGENRLCQMSLIEAMEKIGLLFGFILPPPKLVQVFL
jgi:hypothetical protein